ncbi:leucine zipper domain-containing protein [Lentzea sp. NPDC051208]|uniref:leucine zipper domain-containing protein n=1 Tax=Lentzea sp. NPDC051208 TaxID=3154642 RepID=UPI00343CBB45
MEHTNARLTVHERLVLVSRIAAARPGAHWAGELGVSRQGAHRWVRRLREEGPAGLADRSSRPHRMPFHTSAELDERVVAARTQPRCGPARTGVPARTVSPVPARHAAVNDHSGLA